MNYDASCMVVAKTPASAENVVAQTSPDLDLIVLNDQRINETVPWLNSRTPFCIPAVAHLCEVFSLFWMWQQL